MLKLGDTFLAPKRPSDPEHLWVVITEPDADGKAVVVNVTTRRSYSETTVVVGAGEHDFIKHDSVINYGDAQIADLKLLQANIDSNQNEFVCKSHKPCNQGLIKKIQEGLLNSPRVRNVIKERCSREWHPKEADAKKD